ncbi:MAG: hypothetical protein KGM44_10380, partial [bacterium]|nr:hypothetical protein [bacterium]
GSALATTALLSVDVVLARHYLPPHQVGYYAAASLAGRAILFAMGFLPGVVIPKASALHARGEHAGGVLARALALTGAASLAALLVVAVVPTLIVRIVAGSQYLPAAHYVLPYALAMVFLAGTSALTSYRTSLHRFQYVVPLLGVVLAEIVAMVLWHPSVGAFLTILIAANAAAFVVTWLGANSDRRHGLFVK